MTQTDLEKQVSELTNRVLILEKMVAHILYTDPRDDGDDEEYANPYPDPSQSEDYENRIDEAWKVISDAGKASASYLQRRLSLGYNMAARIMNELERRGIIGPAIGVQSRVVIKKHS